MLQLNLSADSLAPNRAEFTRSYLLGIMLWPDDETARNKWNETQQARHMATLLFGTPAPDVGGLKALFEQGLKATSPTELDALARPLYDQGVMAGEALCKALEDFVELGEFSLKYIRGRQAAPGRRQAHPRLDYSKEAFGRHWHHFARVRHLWAAHAAAALYGYDFELPCHPGRIVHFLATAHAIALAGTHYMQVNQRPPRPILDRVALWSVPSGIHPDIAEVDRVFQRDRKKLL